MPVTQKPRSAAPRASAPAAPVRQYSFTDWQVNNPTAPPPGDRMDAEYDRANSSITDTITWAGTSLNTDGTVRDAIIGQNNLVPGLFDGLSQDVIDEVQPLVDQAESYASAALVSSTSAATAQAAAANSAAAAVNGASSAGSSSMTANTAADDATAAANDAGAWSTEAENAANAASGSQAVCEDYGVLTQAWAEHMPDTIPPNILAVMDVTGDHWSSRWWANQASQIVTEGGHDIVCAVQQYWLGAYPANPTIDACGQPIQVGAAYFNTTVLRSRVFDGFLWHDIVEAVPGDIQEYLYLPSAPVTVFSGPDQHSNTLTFSTTSDEVGVYVNGRKLVEGIDYALADNQVTMLTGPIGPPNVVEIMTVANLALPVPSIGTKINTTIWTFDGVTRTFPLQDGVGNAVLPPAAADCQVSLNGVMQEPGVDFTISTDTITFTDPPPADADKWMVAGLAFGGGEGGQWLPLSGGTMSGTLNITMNGGQLAQFFRYGYGATLPAMTVQTAGTASTQTDFRSLDVSLQATHDDGPAGAQGVLHSALTLTGKSRTDLYAIHATAYIENLTSDLTPFPGGDGSSQHGGIATQTVKILPSGGIPQGKRQPDVFTHWWQNVNQSNQGSAAGGADVLLEADVSGNGPDDFWKLGSSARSCNTTAGSPTLTGMTDTSPFIAGEWINVSQAGDAYVYCRVTAVTANTVTIDTNAVASITGAIAAVAGGTRFSFQNVLSNNVLPAAGGTSFEWAYGHYQNNTDAPASGTATWGVGFAYYGRYYIAASDYSFGRAAPSPYSADGINRGVSIKMAAGQKLALDGDGYRGTWLTGVAGGGLKVVKDGTAIVTFDAAGGILLGSAPTLPAHAATKQYVDNAAVAAGGVTSFNTRAGAVTLGNADVTAVLPGSSTTPAMNGAAAAGSGTTWARADHVHPTDTSRYAANNPAGYVTAAGAAGAAPVQSVAGRSGAVALTHADLTDWATSLAPYAPLASPALTGAPTAPTAAPGTSTTQLATTAFAAGVAAGYLPLSGGTLTEAGTPRMLLTLNMPFGGWSSGNYGKQLLLTAPPGNNVPCLGISNSDSTNYVALANSGPSGAGLGGLSVLSMPAPTDSTTAPVTLAVINTTGVQLFGALSVQGKVGFNNVPPVTRPAVTGSRGGNAALASLITALASYGLITDSTTA